MDNLAFSDLLVKIIISWFALDALILATIWYGASTLQYQFPNWWKSVVCDYAPTTEQFD